MRAACSSHTPHHSTAGQPVKRTGALQHAAGIALCQVATPQAGDGHKGRIDADCGWHREQVEQQVELGCT